MYIIFLNLEHSTLFNILKINQKWQMLQFYFWKLLFSLVIIKTFKWKWKLLSHN